MYVQQPAYFSLQRQALADKSHVKEHIAKYHATVCVSPPLDLRTPCLHIADPHLIHMASQKQVPDKQFALGQIKSGTKETQMTKKQVISSTVHFLRHVHRFLSSTRLSATYRTTYTIDIVLPFLYAQYSLSWQE